MADTRETEKCIEIKHIFDNKLYAAEQKREEEIRKKLEKLREHVGVLTDISFNTSSVLLLHE